MLRTVVVLGGTGVVGSGVVKHFLKDGGYIVVAPVRSGVAKLHEALAEGEEKGKFDNHPHLRAPQLDYGTEEGVKALATYLKNEFKHIDHVFAVGGGMAASKPASEITARDWAETSESKILSQLYAGQQLIPLLHNHDASTYTIVTGALGENCFAPMFALTCMANATVFGLALALQSEHKHQRFRINELRIAALICPDGSNTHPTFGMPATPTSRLAEVFVDRVVNTEVRESIVRINQTDL